MKGGAESACSTGIPRRKRSASPAEVTLHRRSLSQSATPFVSPKAVSSLSVYSDNPRFWGGAVIASSGRMPFLILAINPVTESMQRGSLHQAVGPLVSPNAVIVQFGGFFRLAGLDRRVDSARVTHLQFLGEYPCSL